MTHHSILINPPGRGVVHDLNQHAHQQEVAFRISTLSLHQGYGVDFLTNGHMEELLATHRGVTWVLCVDHYGTLPHLQKFVEAVRNWTVQNIDAPVAFYWQLTALGSVEFAPQFVAALMPLVELDARAARASLPA